MTTEGINEYDLDKIMHLRDTNSSYVSSLLQKVLWMRAKACKSYQFHWKADILMR